jgi:hypothetical protein
MPMSDKTNKFLWGRSANRCALYKKELGMDATETEGASIVDDECHILSKQHNGAKFKGHKVDPAVEVSKNFSTSPEDAFHG